MKIFSQPHPGLISGIIMAFIVLILLTMRVRGDISLLAAGTATLLTFAFWLLANLTVGDLRNRNRMQSEQIRKLWQLIQERGSSARAVPNDDRQDPRRVPDSVRLFREKHPNWK